MYKTLFPATTNFKCYGVSIKVLETREPEESYQNSNGYTNEPSIHTQKPEILLVGKVVFRVCSVGKRWERAALEDLEQLERLVNPHYIESGKIWGGHGPPGPPGSAGPETVLVDKKGHSFYELNN